MKLVSLRRKIDSLDSKIVELLNERASLAKHIAQSKHQTGSSIYAPDREQEVFRKVAHASKGPLSPGSLVSIYREIMSAALALEKTLKIAYLGPEASFSNLAARKRFGSQVSFVACESIADCFAEVERDACDFAVVPIENSIEGAVTHTLDVFVDSDLKICAQVLLNVSHNLLSCSSIGALKKIYSNPFVFGQCRKWLKDHVPHIELIEVSSTTRAAQIAAKEKNSACIASLLAAQVYQLKVLGKNIEDSPNNVTRFLVVGKTEVEPTGNDKTSILFSIKDSVGALHEMLSPFRKHKINLTKIESRPSRRKVWDYYFFVDLKGHSRNVNVQKALKELQNKCTFMKILGSYPVGE